MFEFTQDRAEATPNFGPCGAANLADQTRYRSIWGVVDGRRGASPWTGQMIEGGEIRSADKKARMGGVPVMVDGKYNEVQDAGATFREYQVPIHDVEQWNRYEAQLGNDQVRAFQRKEEEKRHTLGRDPELRIDPLDVHMTPPQILAEQQRAHSSAPKAPRPRSPKQLANDERLRAKAAAKRSETPPS